MSGLEKMIPQPVLKPGVSGGFYGDLLEQSYLKNVSAFPNSCVFFTSNLIMLIVFSTRMEWYQMVSTACFLNHFHCLVCYASSVENVFNQNDHNES